MFIVIKKMEIGICPSKDPKKSLVFEVNSVLNTHQASIMDPLTNEVIVDDILEVISKRGKIMHS